MILVWHNDSWRIKGKCNLKFMEGKLTYVFDIMCDYSTYEIRGISIVGA